MQTRIRVVFGRKRPKCSSLLLAERCGARAAGVHRWKTRGERKDRKRLRLQTVYVVGVPPQYSTHAGGRCSRHGVETVKCQYLLFPVEKPRPFSMVLLWQQLSAEMRMSVRNSVTHSCESVSQIRVRKTFSQNQIMGTSSPMTFCIRPLI